LFSVAIILALFASLTYMWRTNDIYHIQNAEDVDMTRVSLSLNIIFSCWKYKSTDFWTE